MAIFDFSISGRHGFGSVIQVCFGISVSNFMCMSFVAVGRSLTIVRNIAFKMAALWFWTMFNCSPPIAYCYPLLWGGGILVDHWSTISSCNWCDWDPYFDSFMEMLAFLQPNFPLLFILFFCGERFVGEKCVMVTMSLSSLLYQYWHMAYY